jgi:cobaltochelatase CobN
MVVPHIHPPLSCRTSPPQGGRVGTLQCLALWKHTKSESSRALAHMPIQTRKAEQWPHPLSPLVGEMPGRAEGGNLAPVLRGATPC